MPRINDEPIVGYDELFDFIKEFIKTAKHSIEIFSPYIKTDTLARLVKHIPSNVNVTVVTHWNLNDICYGSCDLSVYPFCKSNNIFMYANKRIHLKTVLIDYEHIITGSANLTSRGLGLRENYNHETMVYMETVKYDYRVYLSRIIRESILVNDEHYEFMQKAYDKYSKSYVAVGEIMEEQQKIESSMNNSKFLISELPMSDEIKDIYLMLKNKPISDPDNRACIEHDIATYELDKMAYNNYEQFISVLKERFFKHPFINELCGYIDQKRYFRNIKEWVVDNCVNVPHPSLHEVKPNVVVLYNWLEILGTDRYLVTRKTKIDRYGNERQAGSNIIEPIK